MYKSLKRFTFKELYPQKGAKLVQIKSPSLHEGQKQVVKQKDRFNIVLCGRRFGKTTLIRSSEIALQAAKGKRIAIYAPEFKDIEETWEKVEEALAPVTIKLKKQHKRLTTKSGGVVEFWSLANERKRDSGRGRYYDIAIYDETQKVPSQILEYHWNKVCRPTLADRRGEAWFFGTPPNSRSHFYYKLICYGWHGELEGDIVFDEENRPKTSYKTIRRTSYDNPYLQKTEIDAIKGELPDIVFKQEFLAMCIEYAESPFVVALQKHSTVQRVFKTNLEFKRTNVETWLSFDFNKNPMAATLWQKSYDNTYIACIAEFGAKADEDMTIYDTLEQIKNYLALNLSWNVKQNGIPQNVSLYVTGDATGNTTDPRMKKGLTYYQIILEELMLPKSAYRVPRANPLHSESFMHVNTYLGLHKAFFIDQSKCPRLRKDCFSAQTTADKKIDKKKYDPHYLDTLRYFLEAATPRKIEPTLILKA